MRTFIAVSLLALEVSSALGAKVIPLDYQKVRRARVPGLSKRANYFSAAAGNAENLYYANVSVGTPAQALQLQLDTGSSDVWVTASSASFCAEAQDNCDGGVFESSDSSTYTTVDSAFNITYVDDTGSTGTYFTDDFTIGGVEITGLQMGLATSTTIGVGIIGLSFIEDESTLKQYPGILSDMVSQGKINTRAYSLWLNELEASEGSILFGGVDSDKYTGDLVAIPIQQDIYGQYSSFDVVLTGMSLESSSGTVTSYTASSFADSVILDSGTSLMLLPDALFQTIATKYGATLNSEQGAYTVPCKNGDTGDSLVFKFGSTNGPSIKVPITELFIPIGYDNGALVCEFGAMPADGAPNLFGDTFLRSAYVVYDLDNKQLSIAQSNFNATSSNIKEITSGTAGVPGVSSTASGATVDASAAASSYGVVGTATGVGIVSTTTTTSSFTSTSTAAASGLFIPSTSIAGVVAMGCSVMFAVLGSCLIFL